MSTKRGLLFLLVSCVIFNVSAAESRGILPERTTHIRMRAEPVQWTPESVTVITAEELDATYRSNLEDLDAWAPGVIIDSLANTPQGAAIGMRGISSNETSKGFEPAVPVIVDGVYMGTHTGQLQRLYDVEQIEIVRGPRGTLEGAPSPGGAIHIRRTRPTGTLDLDTRASVNEHNGREFNSRLNFPITDAIAGKITLDWTRGGGKYMKNKFRDRGDENENQSSAVSASLLWNYNDKVELQYTVDLVRDKSDSPALLNLSSQSDLVCITAGTCVPPLAPRVPQTGNINHTLQNFSNDRKYEGEHQTLRAEYKFADHAITSITGLRRTNEKLDQDLDATFVDFYSTRRDQDYEQLSQEFRISSPARDKFHYVAGAYFLETEYDRLQEDHFILDVLADAGLTAPGADGEIRRAITKQELGLQSYFVHSDYILNDQWTADAGVRWNRFKKKFHHTPRGTRLNNTITTGPVVSDSDTSNEISANAGLRFKVDEQAMIWFRYTWDFRPGGFNEDAVSADSAFAYDAETTHGYELGLKSEWFDNHLRLNASVFQMEMKDKTEKFVRTVASGRVESVIDNVASLDITGYELEAEYVPVENLYLRGAFSHLGADYDKFSIPNLAGQDFRDLSGLTPNRSPSKSVFLSARYSFAFAKGHIYAYAGYRYSRDYQTNPRIPAARIGNFGTVDASVAYVWNQWSFRVFSQNVNDKRYLQNLQSPSAAEVVSLDPSTTSPQQLVTWAEYSPPRYTGIQIIYQPWANK